MTTNQQNATLSLAALLLWQPCVVSRMTDPRIATGLMLIGIVITTLLIGGSFGTRRRAALIIGLVVLVTAWASYGCWYWLGHVKPLPGRGIDPFAGAIGVWAIFTFALGLAIWGMAAWVLAKRLGEHLIWRLGFAIGACLVFTSNYFFKLTGGI